MIHDNYFYVCSKVFEPQYKLKPRDIAVYCCICRHYNLSSQYAYPSRSTIARECGISKLDTVDKALRVLVHQRLIDIEHYRNSNGGLGSNRYRLL